MENIYYNITIAIILVIWVPLLYLYVRRDLSRNRYENISRMDSDRSFYQVRELIEELTVRFKDFDKVQRYFPRLVEDVQENVKKMDQITERNYHLNREILERMRYEVRDSMGEFRDSYIKEIQQFAKSSNLSTGESVFNSHVSSEQIIREISHSINTPISVIEVSSEILSSQLESIETATKEELMKSVSSIISSVNLCKSIIASFRELILLVESSTVWSPESINSTLASLANSLKNKNSKECSIAINFPDNINGYSNNYILTLLLPLIENAIEAAKPNTEIKIDYRLEESKNHIIEVACFPSKFPNSDEIYNAGFTTKENHEGLGLAIVNHLLSQYKGLLAHKKNKNQISFKITLKAN